MISPNVEHLLTDDQVTEADGTPRDVELGACSPHRETCEVIVVGALTSIAHPVVVIASLYNAAGELVIRDSCLPTDPRQARSLVTI